MSSNFSFPGNQYDHFLNIVQGGHPDFLPKVAGTLSSNVTAELATVTPHAGQVVHVVTPQALTQPLTSRGPYLAQFEMGCAVDKAPPIWLENGLYDKCITNKGTPAGTAAQGTTSVPPSWYSLIPASHPTFAVLNGVVGFAGLQLETTEYDTDQTYTSGQPLRAVTSNSNANAGKLTNQNASGGAGFASGAAFAPGTDTVVAYVHRGEYRTMHDKDALNVVSHYVRGTR